MVNVSKKGTEVQHMIRNVDRNGNDIDLTKIVLTRKTHPAVFQIIDRMNGGDTGGTIRSSEKGA